mgnify:CR=1 FL=1
MKILHITTNTSGGAATACIWLHQGLLDEQIHSRVLCLKDYAHVAAAVPGIREFAGGPVRSIIRKGKYWLYEQVLNYKLRNQPPGFEIFSTIRTLYDITKHPAYKEADIIHLHWVARFMDFSSFFRVNKKPVVWTMHDMFPFTGGCHHSDGCKGFERDCANCPQLQGCPDESLAFHQLAAKKESMESANDIHIVTPSEWLGQLSKKSALFQKYPHSVIANGFPVDTFRPGNQQRARQKLGLPADKKIILFVSHSVGNIRKGMPLLLDALKKVTTPDLLLVSVGKEDVFSTSLPIQKLGTIASPSRIALAYQAADVFVLPSLAENLPNTIAEALLCGTPAVAFGVGGIPEMITDGENGYVCPPGNPLSLAAAIDRFFENKAAFNPEEIHSKASEKYGLKGRIKKYIRLYNTELSFRSGN